MNLNILLICNKPNEGGDANTISDHIDSMVSYSKHQVWAYSNLGDLSNRLNLNKFDVIIIHYSISLLSEYFLSASARKKIRAFSGLKVVFIQDEYRQINKAMASLSELRMDVLFSCFPDSELDRIYPEEKIPKLAKYSNLTGYIPERLLKWVPSAIQERPLEVGYRGRKLPFWYGELAYEKWNIVDRWKQFTKDSNLKTDISYHEKHRLYGKKWIDFLLSCKTTLGVESGASVMDFTGELEKRIDLHQLSHPKDTFYQVQDLYLKAHEGQYKLNQISPRCFEAAALKTVLVLYEGEYSNILIPGRHYIPLKKDFSNISEVIHCIQDDEYLQAMANTTYEEIALNPHYGYAHFVKFVDETIEKEFIQRNKKNTTIPYELTTNHLSTSNPRGSRKPFHLPRK